MQEAMQLFKEWWSQLPPAAQVTVRDAAILLSGLIGAWIAAAIVRALLRWLRFDLYAIPPWRLEALRAERPEDRARLLRRSPTAMVALACRLTVWAAALAALAGLHGHPEIPPRVQTAGLYAWEALGVILGLMLVAGWFARRIQDLVQIPWLQQSLDRRLAGGGEGASTFSHSAGQGVVSLVYMLAVLVMLLALAEWSHLERVSRVLLAAVYLALGALAAVAALALGWIGAAWLRSEEHRSQREAIGENSTHLAVLGTIFATIVLSIIMLASGNLWPVVLIMIAVLAGLLLLRGQAGEAWLRIGAWLGDQLRRARQERGPKGPGGYGPHHRR